MTNQEAFDIVSVHLLKQNCKSQYLDADYSLQCAYRGQSGTRCAVGVLIPDDQYHPSLEGRGVLGITRLNEVPALAGLDVELLRQLQCIHDTVTPSDWNSALRRVARRHLLSEKAMDEYLAGGFDANGAPV